MLAGWLIYASFFTMLGLWFSMTSKTTMRATVYTMLTTMGLAVGHWLIWLCCAPLFIFAGRGGADDAVQLFTKFQFGITPPLCLGMFAFQGYEFANEWGSREAAAYMGFCILGAFLWALAAFVFWAALLSPRFRVFTGREEERFPEKDYDPREDDEERPLPRRGPPPIPN
jgi:hypothetical protein